MDKAEGRIAVRSEPAPPGPLPAGERIPFLDILRGIAILGILPANIPYFATPVVSVEHAGSRGDLFACHMTRFFVDAKFITIFSFLFGVGMALMQERAMASAAPRSRVLIRRLVILFCMGVLHAVLVWYGDVVSTYAVLGLLAFWTTRWTSRRLAWVGAGLILVPAVVMMLAVPLLLVYQEHPPVKQFLQYLDAASQEDAPAAAATGSWKEFWDGVSVWGPQFEEAVYREGSFLRITILRTLSWAVLFFLGNWYAAWRILGLILLGMACAKAGWFLRPEESGPRFTRLFRLGLWFGIPLQAASLVLDLGGLGGWGGQLLGELTLYLGSLGLSAAYTGLAAFLALGSPFLRAQWVLARVGRTAFSNYLFQSLLCTTIFYSYGLGLFGSLNRLQLWGVVALVWGLELLLSSLWLRFFRYGPLEWLWRMLTYRRWQPLLAR